MPEITTQELREMQACFNSFDLDGSGSIDSKELEECFKKLGIVISKSKVVELINKVDEDGNGLIDFSEFVEMVTKVMGKEQNDITCSFSSEMLQDFREAFNKYDADRNGKIDATELGCMLASLGIRSSKQEVLDLIADIDEDDSGAVEFDEFLYLMKYRLENENEGEELLEAFKIFDQDGDGFITPKELQTTLLSLGESLTDEETEKMIQVADSKKQGKVDFADFVKIYKQ